MAKLGDTLAEIFEIPNMQFEDSKLATPGDLNSIIITEKMES